MPTSHELWHEIWNGTWWILAWDAGFLVSMPIFAYFSRRTTIRRTHFWMAVILAAINCTVLITTFTMWHSVHMGILDIMDIDEKHHLLWSGRLNIAVHAFGVAGVTALIILVARICVRNPMPTEYEYYRPRLWMLVTLALANAAWFFTLALMPLRDGRRLLAGKSPMPENQMKHMLVDSYVPLTIIALIIDVLLIFPFYEAYIQAYRLYFVKPKENEPPRPFPRGHRDYMPRIDPADGMTLSDTYSNPAASPHALTEGHLNTLNDLRGSSTNGNGKIYSVGSNALTGAERRAIITDHYRDLQARNLTNHHRATDNAVSANHPHVGRARRHANGALYNSDPLPALPPVQTGGRRKIRTPYFIPTPTTISRHAQSDI
ncbi:MAG: hypothetical protein M1825_001369 [Sarcosagium campestre]|nr:MAG: hypothetical protein M1825_001369 [Sarcosagium campestre]